MSRVYRIPIEVAGGSSIRMPNGDWQFFPSAGTYTVEVRNSDLRSELDPRIGQAVGLLNEVLECAPTWSPVGTSTVIEPQIEPDGEDG